MTSGPQRERSRRGSPRPAPSPAQLADPRVHARTIADAVVGAWHRFDNTGRIDVPLSVVATLASLSREGPGGDELVAALAECDASDIAEYVRFIWTKVINDRPEFTPLLYPMIKWVFESDQTTFREAAHAVARAAVSAGQLDLTGTERRFEVDLLGVLLVALRPRAGIQQRGQFYTPPEVGKLAASILDIPENRRVIDPMMGTGGMFRAAAETMREQGREPQAVQWVGCDIDNMAVACAAVNSMIWGLGDDIVFFSGDTFTEDWIEFAVKQRNELRDLAARVRHLKRLLALVGRK